MATAEVLEDTVNVDILNELKIEDVVEDIVNPWTVSSASKKGIDYDKLISKEIMNH